MCCCIVYIDAARARTAFSNHLGLNDGDYYGALSHTYTVCDWIINSYTQQSMTNNDCLTETINSYVLAPCILRAKKKKCTENEWTLSSGNCFGHFSMLPGDGRRSNFVHATLITIHRYYCCDSQWTCDSIESTRGQKKNNHKKHRIADAFGSTESQMICSHAGGAAHACKCSVHTNTRELARAHTKVNSIFYCTLRSIITTVYYRIFAIYNSECNSAPTSKKCQRNIFHLKVYGASPVIRRNKCSSQCLILGIIIIISLKFDDDDDDGDFSM